MKVKARAGNIILKKAMCIFGAYLAYALFILAVTLVTYWTNASEQTLRILSFASFTAGTFLAAFFGAYLSSSKGWLNGLVCAGVYLGLVLLTGVIINAESCNIIGFLIKAPLLLVIAGLSGAIGINVKKG